MKITKLQTWDSWSYNSITYKLNERAKCIELRQNYNTDRFKELGQIAYYISINDFGNYVHVYMFDNDGDIIKHGYTLSSIFFNSQSNKNWHKWEVSDDLKSASFIMNLDLYSSIAELDRILYTNKAIVHRYHEVKIKNAIHIIDSYASPMPNDTVLHPNTGIIKKWKDVHIQPSSWKKLIVTEYVKK